MFTATATENTESTDNGNDGKIAAANCNDNTVATQGVRILIEIESRNIPEFFQ